MLNHKKGEKTGSASSSCQHNSAKSMNKKVYYFKSQEEQRKLNGI